eukprot:CAMPEP_0173390760 /NCGR_PEP_ID=MMETSP1356-20130122/16068_1 /TAXON_ID=77927 ORGANISM="Hemiselmis virescens, Strain PCC157" /NCGR_SAMPLE_ID=MMETSP1356 /ASSEMBLY_ACC=CAM_ASM_000847 /LENGTH=328 /DNA_ID=CAMNT_0014348227 /DNA_START=20 /DNA_END=1006 /DNA_ORIENTATION=-
MLRRRAAAVAAAMAIMTVGVVVCVALISSSDLGRSELKSKDAKQVKQGSGSFVLNYLKSNQDVDGGPPEKHRMSALSGRAIRREGRRNVDDLGMHFAALRRAAVGPDGLSDQGDISDISLLHQLGGEMHSDAVHADAIDYAHRAAQDATLGFGAGARTHDMGHAAAAVDERVAMGMHDGGDFTTGFHALAGVDNRDVDALGGAVDQDVFGMVKRATFHPSVQDVNVGGAAMAALRGGDSLSPKVPKAVRDAGRAEQQSRRIRHSAEMGSLASTMGDSEAEASADPRHEEMEEEREEAASSDKGIWIEPGSGKGGDSFALDSLQVKKTA